MAKLYQLTKDLEAAYQLLYEDIDEDGGVKPEAVALLKECNVSFEEKLSGLAEFYKRLSVDLDAYSKEEARLKNLKEKTKKKIDWLKEYVKKNMQDVNREKFETISCKIYFKKAESVNILDETKIPENYKKIKTETVLDKDTIKKALKNGECVPGAELIENLHTQIK